MLLQAKNLHCKCCNSAVYTKADGTKVVKRPDGTTQTNIDGSAGNDVPASDVIVSFQDAAGNTTGGNPSKTT